jgi:hypothetical protein
MTETQYETEGQRRLELCRQADQFLAEHRLDIFGRPKGESDFQQNRFEGRMQTGAYSNSGEKRK